MTDIYQGFISVKFCLILPQTIRVIKIFLPLWTFIVSEIINTKNTENQQYIYI